MISVNNKTFYLNGKDYTYAIFVNEAGYLQHAYYGKKVGSEVVDYTVSQVGEKFEPKKMTLMRICVSTQCRANAVFSDGATFGKLRLSFKEVTALV